MSHDHFVAQTYLERFAQPLGTQLRGYSKSKLTDFPCWPKDICREWNGDVVPDFLVYPNALGDFRKMFERYWKPAIANLIDYAFAGEDVKLAVSGYAANLLGATPAMQRLSLEVHNHQVVETLRAKQALLAQRGIPDPMLVEGLRMIDAGALAIETDPNWVRAKSTQRLMSFAWRIFNSDWVVIKNITPTDFITSDNPFAFEDPGPFRGGPAILPRYLPLAPKFCLYVIMTDEDFGPINLELPPKGKVRFATQDKVAQVDRINELVVQCAEELLVASTERDDLKPLVERYAKHRVSSEFFTIAEPDSVLQGLRSRVWDPGAQPRNWTWPPHTPDI